jgi:hypothetical protein
VVAEIQDTTNEERGFNTMVTNDGYLEQTRRLLADAQSELGNIETQITELEERRATLIAEVQAYELAMEGYFRRLGKPETIEPDWTDVLKSQETHKKRLVAIAREKGGRIRVSEATDILYTKHFIKAAKRATAYAMIQRFLREMAEEGKFRKIAPGKYELIGAQRSLLNRNVEERR